MNIFQIIVLGAVQGATEFIPVSSSAHILIFEKILGVSSENENLNAISVFLHLGTLIALLLYYRLRLKTYALDLFSKDKQKARTTLKLVFKIAIASIPIALVGFLIENNLDEFYGKVENQDKALLLISTTLFLFGLLFIFSEKLFKNSNSKITELKYKNSFFIGLLQILALIYGISRSGSTIIAGMLNGLKKEEALDFSFLVSIPVVGGATIYKTSELIVNNSLTSTDVTNYIAGVVSSFVVGYFSISFLFKFIKTNNLKIFGIYRILLSAGIILMLLFNF